MDTPGTEPSPSALGHDANADGDLGEVARHTTAYLKAWTHLLSSEAAVAKANLSHLAIGALLVPALALAAVVALDAVLATLVFELLHHWLYAALVVLVVDAAALLYLLWLLRSWWRTLSLPHSRQALTRLWRGHADASQEGKSAPARSAA